MSPRALLRAVAALVVLLVLWGLFALFRGSVGEGSAGALALPALTPADVDRITVARDADTLTFTRDGAGWLVNGYRADAAQLDQLFGALADSGASSELVARSEGSHARMGVDGAGRRVRFLQGETVLLDLVLGGRGRGYQTAYVREADASEVFLYRGRLPGLLDRDLDAWRDRRIAQVAAEAVDRVLVGRGGRVAEIARAADGWTVGGAAADSGAVASLLRALGDLSAIGFATGAQRDSLDFAAPDRTLTVLGAAGDTLLALAFDSTATGYWARPAAGGTVYRLDFWRVNELTPADSTLAASRGE